jgi:cell division protease FtsH
VFGHDHGQPFLGREFSSEPDYSDEIAREIDDEIRRIVEEAHQRRATSSRSTASKLDVTSEILLRRETIEREQFIELLEGKSEDEVFGAEEPASRCRRRPPRGPERKPAPAPAPKLPPRPGRRPAEMRADRPRPRSPTAARPRATLLPRKGSDPFSS